jgi:hypothetical protein
MKSEGVEFSVKLTEAFWGQEASTLYSKKDLDGNEFWM